MIGWNARRRHWREKHPKVKWDRFSHAESKRGYAYVLTPKGLAEKAAITARFLARKRLEYAALRAELEELAAELDNDRS